MSLRAGVCVYTCMKACMCLLVGVCLCDRECTPVSMCVPAHAMYSCGPGAGLPPRVPGRRCPPPCAQWLPGPECPRPPHSPPGWAGCGVGAGETDAPGQGLGCGGRWVPYGGGAAPLSPEGPAAQPAPPGRCRAHNGAPGGRPACAFSPEQSRLRSRRPRPQGEDRRAADGPRVSDFQPGQGRRSGSSPSSVAPPAGWERVGGTELGGCEPPPGRLGDRDRPGLLSWGPPRLGTPEKPCSGPTARCSRAQNIPGPQFLHL